ncbi:hypothetical protein DV737_g3535, partial [Chaetothyriales sp. CBS 132003]
MSIYPPPRSNPTEAITVEEHIPVDDLGAELEQLFSFIAQFAAVHLKHDSNPLDDPQMPRFIKAMLTTGCGGLVHCHSMLSDAQGRAQVYAQFICMILESTVLTADAFRGFNEPYDDAVRDAHMRCYELMQPAARFAILTKVANTFQSAVRERDFDAFLEARVIDHCESIAAFITPLLASKADNTITLCTPIWNDLQLAIRNAYAVSRNLHRYPVRYLFTYFDANTPFQQAEMTPWAPASSKSSLTSSPLTSSALEQEGYLVVFAATPRVEMRMYTRNGLISTRTIAKAVVAVKKPPPSFSEEDKSKEGDGNERLGRL